MKNKLITLFNTKLVSELVMTLSFILLIKSVIDHQIMIKSMNDPKSIFIAGTLIIGFSIILSIVGVIALMLNILFTVDSKVFTKSNSFKMIVLGVMLMPIINITLNGIWFGVVFAIGLASITFYIASIVLLKRFITNYVIRLSFDKDKVDDAIIEKLKEKNNPNKDIDVAKIIANSMINKELRGLIKLDTISTMSDFSGSKPKYYFVLDISISIIKDYLNVNLGQIKHDSIGGKVDVYVQ